MKISWNGDDIFFMFEWCVNQFGMHSTPRFSIRWEIIEDYDLVDEDGILHENIECEFSGIYDMENHMIEISRKLNQSIREVCSTFIHEYIHSIQPNIEGELYVHPELYYDYVPELLENEEVEHQAEYIALENRESLRKKLLEWRRLQKRQS